MKFAHFSHVWAKPGLTSADRYKQLWREIELCDQLKFNYAFCVEHHFRPDESLMSSPTIFATGAGLKTKNIRVGPMGYIVPLYNPLRLVEEIAIIDQMLEGRLELGLVPGVNPIYFEPFNIKYDERKSPTIEFVDYLKTAFSVTEKFDFNGNNFVTKNAKLAVKPTQIPHPPLWIQSRDSETLDFCAKNGINTGYFLVYPRDLAFLKYKEFLSKWISYGWRDKPNIAYSTVVYVDETDKKAIDNALIRASKAYEGILEPPENGTFEERVLRFEKRVNASKDEKTATLMKNMFNPKYILENDLMLIGSPETIIKKLKKISTSGHFNTFFGEFNFSDLPEEDLMRSISLFGEYVIPELKNFDPF